MFHVAFQCEFDLYLFYNIFIFTRMIVWSNLIRNYDITEHIFKSKNDQMKYKIKTNSIIIHCICFSLI